MGHFGDFDNRGEIVNCFLFEGLSEADMMKLKSLLGDEITVSKGTEIYKTNHIGILCCGSATVSRIGDGGKSVTMRSIGAGEIFGSASLFGNWKEGSSSIISERECRVIYISEADFKEIVSKFPDVCFNYIKFLTDRIRFLNRKVDTFSAGSTESRLYEFLLSLADNEGNIKTKLSMAELARRLKIGRSSLYRGIEALQEKGLVTKNDQTFKIKK